ncbi:glycine-rich domain-containing protein [uncultured Citrobacter sp.]|uniref:glycine-rich domain-containing protein n=1 Tax=uncultured Citrobacter sp. TaxID=200446 RepID=UPI002599F144|nr:hypothetical protein [uncultured Citrobacter sp.]
MNSSDIPSRLNKAFAINGLKNVISVDSSTTTDNSGTATFDKGFPPITMQPLSAGGIPPSGKDMNGVLFTSTLKQQWADAGGAYPFNQSFSTAIGGYPQGAVIPATNLSGQWLNLLDGNATNPEAADSSTTGWVPLSFYGATNISGLSGVSITLNSLQAARDILILSGVLTSNINIILPSWVKVWRVINNCSGSFQVTLKTLTGSGVQCPQKKTTLIRGDGSNILSDVSIQRGCQTFTSNGSFTVPDGITTLYISGSAGGGGGGGGYSSSNSGQGGGAGQAIMKQPFQVNPGDVIPITIGAGGSAGSVASAGGNGGNTIIGTLTTMVGGGGGNPGSASEGGKSAGLPGGSGGVAGEDAIGSVPGSGGPCLMGPGGSRRAAAGIAGINGGGGAGGYVNASGGNGGAGVVIIEY